ncbi:phosphoribosylformylglycinamidine cyclo-ligase [Frankia casuarinae]|uniref:Phosphoribosylformylglycinamidine cyclo-ligase n=2 Tax=Frankia casuarinae (strain DSM 45818 / CECT 9043 / HFP020203 / CcI3) TaxID=106370 RepID=Q2JGV3_FRACC|nr:MULTISPECIES: phosphoribosylformylglycinamidine cyclo-ligase [Frankia]ABD09489.1 phosphoribosylformylglycinamidine cyclo-ligase [Frankia casuarinae]ETA02822.1 phosphoribosylformylglycinamidine cyclo-ligase [Frankia sp. CcI6]EYT94105.1 phosphoribosylformylglycinamidine cyclo-ligase [Frankia casuarinae]KDA44295.1 phosphoribosylformylglycinamidine cyclo-ligase [Frankia sp. BMG5.23]OHV52302.1 phosphoribosylformylglycinamidine cyclo-ligase [Frankia sp. CgIS1]
MSGGLNSYRAAGVNVAAGERAVELMRGHVARAIRPEVVGSLGGFAGLFALDTARYRRPLLASSTDGVGTKIAVARALDTHDTVGIDLVAMVVDDLVVCGAEPLFLLDYIACGSLVPARVAEIVSGIATGCEQAGAALVGGETAEHPGLMGSDDYDLAATGVGVVEADDVLGPERVRPGDVVVAMASSGIHSNGFSLVRHILFGPVDSGQPGGIPETAREDLEAYVPSLGGTLGTSLLVPTRIYARDCLALAAAVEVHTFAHITGGGLAANLARVIPPGLLATVDRASWSVPPIFGLLAERGEVTQADMEATFNQGVGMVAVLPATAVADALALLAARDVPAWVAGEVGTADAPEPAGVARARLAGRHPR